MWKSQECFTPEDVCRLLDKHGLSKDDVIITETLTFTDAGEKRKRNITVYWKTKDGK